MADDDAAYMLASWAKQFTRHLLDICRSKRKKLSGDVLCQAGEIATRLQIVCPYIESLPRYWIEPDVNQLCCDLLKDLVTICLWPEKMHILPGFIVAQCNDFLAKTTGSSMKRSISEYFSRPGTKEDIDSFRQGCRKLHESLAPTGAEEAQGPPPSLQSIAQHDHSKHNRALFEVLQKHCQCLPNFHGTPNGDPSWHPTRLCLEGDSDGASFGILVSSLDMSHWQELRLTVPLSDLGATTDSEILDHGRICALVEEKMFARIRFEFKPEYGLYQLPRSEAQELIPAAGQGESLASILRHYWLTPRDRILLSYSVARTYWQFYDSELMRRKWNSETIWFMPTTNSECKDALPLQAFISFPFDAHSDHVQEFIHDLRIPLNHRCPRVFALGILLLEIGLARPFPTRRFKDLNSQANSDHTTAMNLLQTLRKSKWDGFSHMRYFIDAVEYCLDGGNFIQNANDLDYGRRKPQLSENQNDFSMRRKNLYNRVVRPLAWLAVKGFNSNSAGTTYINKMANARATATVGLTPHAQTNTREVNFHSGLTTPSNWMQNLKGMSAHVDRIWSELGITTPVRVAILDTGVNCEMPFYQDEEYGDDRLQQVEYFRDFLTLDSSSKRDDFGHGSLMARLVAESTPFESTPFVTIMVARVARNTRDLAKCQDKIAEAIQWAGREGADIISMSFGFPKTHQGISQAIHEVSSREGGAIFLASAGNSADHAETFPARHPEVISIYATNRYGTFLEFNSQRPNDGANILGTFGDGIPPDIAAEFEREYRGVCRPGSSVATAVTAGMAATMLAYIAALPQLFASSCDSKTLQALRRAHCSRGMQALLRGMATKSSDGRFFINPVHFWGVSYPNEAKFHAISHLLWDVDRYM
ncbi:hypothetical protein B0I35DRAFT_483543 [Stachybotrys elegans]|uniref:Peptidase S8/S53 domain-containing protein n=1 Tax=Stachybotrys elegans TaxID=80388 RepID=A0A8K0SBK3_9HYPO|nr:hypothetical protein B0I35DRAFT_483543 [Stachybotrys elegans]